MTYQLELEIRGVVGFVKRERNGVVGYDIVVPNTLRGESAPGPRDPKEKRDAADGTELLRHDPTLFVGDAAIALRGYWITFDFQGQPPSVKWDAKGGSLPSMELVAGKENCRLHNDCLPETAAQIKPNALAGLLRIDRGHLETVASAGSPLTIQGLPDKIGKKNARPGQNNLTAAGLLWRVEFPKPPSGQLRVAAASGTGVEYSISVPIPEAGGVIRGHLMNHRAQLGHPHGPAKGTGDPDFKWFYEMLGISSAIKTHYGGKSNPGLPFPHPGLAARATGISTPCRPCEFCE